MNTDSVGDLIFDIFPDVETLLIEKNRSTENTFVIRVIEGGWPDKLPGTLT